MKTKAIEKDYSGSTILKVIAAILVVVFALGFLLYGIFGVIAFFAPDTSIFTFLPFLAPKTAITHIGANNPATIGERLVCLFLGLSSLSASIGFLGFGFNEFGIIEERYDEKSFSLFSDKTISVFIGATVIFAIVAFIMM